MCEGVHHTLTDGGVGIKNKNKNRVKVKYRDRYKRQATQHGCLTSLLGDGDEGIEIVYGEEKKYFVLGLTQPRQNKNPSHLYSLSPHLPQSAVTTPL
jgi:hypothetical protein